MKAQRLSWFFRPPRAALVVRCLLSLLPARWRLLSIVPRPARIVSHRTAVGCCDGSVRRVCHVCCVALLGALLVGRSLPAFAAEAADNAPKQNGEVLGLRVDSERPKIAGPSDEGQKAIARFELADNLKVDLVAAEPSLANPVAFWIDEQGRFYVAETFRHSEGVTDTRKHMNWLADDLACRTPEDRVRMYRKYYPTDFEKRFATQQDRLRLLVDTDGDGRVDRSTAFVEGFRQPADGIGAGVLVHNGDVYYACIPHLWRFRDTDGDGHADEGKPLLSGFGVHVGFLGHDLHGLRIGPDGRLYFSIGDRGFHVETPEGTLSYPDTGAVLRCELDGSQLEVFATGLRNPQELAFDQYGNLFTCDNNSDSGDRARWVYVVDGGDSGWRIGWQFIKQPVPRGPWNSEKLWYPAWDGQPAHIVPPIANLIDGPSGLAYYPGTGFGRWMDGHFLLCDFRGANAISGVWSLALRPHGASFELVDLKHFVWKVLATDVDFGPDGAAYFTDWVQGWPKPGKGRIYRVFDPQQIKSDEVRHTRQLLARDMNDLTTDELVALLAHRDMRVRQKAQFALVARGEVEPLTAVAQDSSQTLLARLHAAWGLGQLARRDPQVATRLMPLLDDEQPELRVQAAKLLGEAAHAPAAAPLIELLHDAAPRVRFFAAIALGRLHAKDASRPLLELLRDNADRDAYLRHAGVISLARIGDLETLHAAADDLDASVRLGVLLAYRRLARAEVARFLNDPQPRLVTEAARAIYDVPIAEAMPRLALLAERRGLDAAALRRALNANNRLGGAEAAQRVAAVAARNDVPEAIRIEALDMLGSWAEPGGIDRVTGLWRPIESRPSADAAAAMRTHLGGMLTAPEKVRQKAVEVAAALGIRQIGPMLFELLHDADQPPAVQAQAVAALVALGDQRRDQALSAALASPAPAVRIAAYRGLAETDPARAVAVLGSVLQSDQAATLREKQQALRLLGSIDRDDARRLLDAWLDRLAARQVPDELKLDLYEAVAASGSEALTRKLADIRARQTGDHPLAEYEATIVGGDAERGREIFLHRTSVSCLRCHRVDGIGGRVGPDLSDIGARQQRRYLLEAIVVPSKAIAKGFESVVVETVDGHVYTGVLHAETDRQIELVTADGKTVTIAKDEIDARSASGKSAMPDDLIKQLSQDDLRDLIEFLASLKKSEKKPATQ